MKVSVSFLSNSFKSEDLIKKNNLTSSDYLHVDIMDGKFVENKTFTLTDIKKYNDISNKKLDVHLMVNNPEKYIEPLAMLNTEYITFHIEAIKNIDKVIDTIKNYGLKCGISIKPETNIEEVFPYLKKIDLVLVMSVNPGKSGQVFINDTLEKIKKLKEEILREESKVLIEVDGGINNETSVLCKENGADMLVSASYLHNMDMIKGVSELKEL